MPSSSSSFSSSAFSVDPENGTTEKEDAAIPSTSNLPVKVRVGETAFNTESTTSNDHPVIDCCLSESKAAENETGKTGKLSGGKVLERIKNRFRRTCTTRQLIRRLPIINWLQTYSLNSAFCDCMAGITVALTAIPQGIAYGAVAGVPVEYGMYTAFAGPFIYALLGSVSQVTVGPTAVMALMAYEYVQKGGPAYAIVLSFLAGCVELLAGLLNLGFVMDFISGPVIFGFCSAAATTVIFSQIKILLGLKFRGSAFLTVISGIFTNWQAIRLWDAGLGLAFIVLLLLLTRVEKFLWFISTCRNAIALVFGCLLTFVLDLNNYRPFDLTGEIKSGIPVFQLPPFSFARPVESLIKDNESFNWTETAQEPTYITVTFDVILKDLGAGLALVPVIAILEQIAIAKAFSNGAKTDSTQEMIALGAGSIFCSFFGCIPLTASFARSSVLSASGGKTQLASFFNGCTVLLALAFLMPTFYFIPKTVLAAVIISAVYPMIEYHEILPMWRGRRIELIPFAATYCCCLLINMEYGILIGAQVHLLLVVFEASRPKSTFIRYKEADEEYIVLQADRNLYFPSVERFRNTLGKASLDKTINRFIILDMSRVNLVDYTSLKMLKSMLTSWDKKEVKYRFINVKSNLKKSLLSVLPTNVSISGSDESAAAERHTFPIVEQGEVSSVFTTLD
ncbi:hypothetical protein DAPPUDRAFT_321675 [Daphnia pulex]|uniref:STAS domain-containing protein n=1 Tax=Daphnia pulex TaxID=6669 RepID=E9GTJ6_DAPPU|nr:hypothetical protein DAPPUDRAFT_321675 [Daphnia pulex]|eukprot:EFX77094.1 hypothetical protein DAPPUDRAFT_321675 [Daphnia pulex]